MSGIVAIAPRSCSQIRAGARLSSAGSAGERRSICLAGLVIKRGRKKIFAICDAGMHTLIRPALYRAYHVVWPVRRDGGPEAPPHREALEAPGLEEYDVVGPICETGDFLARKQPLPPVSQGDLLAVFSAGAYGMSRATTAGGYSPPDRSASLVIRPTSPARSKSATRFGNAIKALPMSPILTTTWIPSWLGSEPRNIRTMKVIR